MGTVPHPVENRPEPEPYHRGLHILAWLVAIVAFPLIFMGGLVTSHGAGLAVPDWPNSFGYNMFALPIERWFGAKDVFLEHTHRVIGSVVGFLAILLFLASWRTRHRPLALAVLAAVVIQGVVGGFRVTERNTELAIIHGCFGQAVFCLMALMIVRTSRWWGEVAEHDPRRAAILARRLRPESGDAEADRLAYSAGTVTQNGELPTLVPDAGPAKYRLVAGLALLATALVFGQLIVGAVMRHYGAGLAIPDLPLAYGQWLPPTTPEELAKVNAWRMTQSTVTLDQVWMHFAHRVGAVLVTIVLLGLVLAVFRRHPDSRALRVPAIWLLLLLAAQLTLGVLTVLLRKPADIATAHVAVGALVLVTTFVLTVRALHLSGPAPAAPAPAGPYNLPEQQPA